MNYDYESRHLYENETWKRREPDCSPHPFDLIAVYALYQTVPVVSVSGQTSGVEGDPIRLTSSVSGGVGPFSYSWSSPSNLLQFSTSPHASSVNLTLPDIDGEISVRPIVLVVRDSRGIETRTSVYITTVGR